MIKTQVAERVEKLQAGAIDVESATKLRAEIGLSPKLKQKIEDIVQDLYTSFETSRSADKKKELAYKLGSGLYVLRRDADAADFLAEVKTERDGAWLLARCLVELKKYDEADALLKRKNLRVGEGVEIDIDLADLERRKGNQQEALKMLDKLLRDHGTRADLHYQKGRCLEEGGEYEDALTEYERALDLDPAYAAAAFRLAFQHDLRGDEEEAIKYYRRCTYEGNFYVDALMNLGLLYEDRGNYHEAHRCFLSVINACPQNQQARMYLKDVESSFHMKIDDDMLWRPDARMRLLETPITEFELSARSRNCLESMGIKSLGDLVAKGEKDLMGHRNFGETSLAEVKQLLRAKGLELGEPIPKFAHPPGFARLPGADADLLNKPLTELDMSARARKCVETLHLQTVGDLADKTEKELLQCRNVGVTTVEELEKKLGMFSLTLRKEA